MGESVSLEKVIAVVDRGDAHGLSISSFMMYMVAKRRKEVHVIPAVLGEVYQKLHEIENAATNIDTFDVLVADLPIPLNEDLRDKTVEFYKQLNTKGFNVYFVDHHPTSEQFRPILSSYTKTFVVASSGVKMSNYLLKAFGFEKDPTAALMLYAGNYADVDCEAMKKAEDDKMIAVVGDAMDYMLRRYGYLVAAHLVAFKLSALNFRFFMEMAEKSPVKQWANRVKAIANRRGDIAIIDDEDELKEVARSGWMNKAINKARAEGFANVFVVKQVYYDSRTSKYLAAIKVYGDPCSDVMSKVKEALNEEEVEAVVGHKSFAIVIVGSGSSEEEVRQAYGDKMKKVMEKVLSALT